MIGLTITTDIERLQRSMTAIQKTQVPFAVSGALTATAFDVRRQIVERTYPRSFDVRDPRFINAALRVDKATKRHLVARVYDRFERAFLQLQARGGVKHPRGNTVAIPTERVAARRGARGVPKSLRPRAVLDKANAFVRIIGGKKIIMRRVGPKRSPRVEPLYVLAQTAQVPKHFPFYEVAGRVVHLRMSRNFHKSFERAMRTARR